MKRLALRAGVLLVLWFLMPLLARAEGEIALARDALVAGMERSWAQGYEPAVQGDSFVILLPLSAPEGAGRLTATLAMADSAVTPFRAQSLTVAAARDENGLWPVRFRLRLLSDYQSGDYPCTVHIEGNGCRADLPLLLKVRGGRAPEGDGAPTWSGISADLWAGEDGLLSATLTNPWPDRALRGLTLTVTDAAGEILPRETDRVALPDLAPGESAPVAFPTTVLPGASSTPHALRLELSGAVLGEQRTFAQTFYLPVRQELRLEQGGLTAAASVLQGDAVSFSLPLMNLGRTELRNVCATLRLPGVAERQSVLVGAIPAGETRVAKLSCLAPKDTAPGDYGGTLSVTAEDEWGNPAALELPVAIRVEESVAPDENEGAAPAEAARPDTRLIWALAGLCAALALALIVQGTLLRGRLRRLEEARL